MTAAIVRDWPYARLVAHRGAGKLAPENTLTAMRVGHAHGYRMVEFDVKLSADNLSFLLHDATLERTTSGRGRADALPWRELSRLDAGGWHSAKYAGEPLPTFASIARWARAHGVACNVEIKPMPGRERETGAAVALDAAAIVARRRGAAAPVVVFGRRRSMPRGDAVPALPRALLVDTRCPPIGSRASRGSSASRSTSITSCSTPTSCDARERRVTACSATRRTSPSASRTLAAWGVDGIITDAVDHVAADSLPPPLPLP